MAFEGTREAAMPGPTAQYIPEPVTIEGTGLDTGLLTDLALKALYYTAVLNGIVAPPLLLMIMLIGNNQKIMKDKVNRRLSNTLGWITTIAMSITTVALLLSLGFGQ